MTHLFFFLYRPVQKGVAYLTRDNKVCVTPKGAGNPGVSRQSQCGMGSLVHTDATSFHTTAEFVLLGVGGADSRNGGRGCVF